MVEMQYFVQSLHKKANRVGENAAFLMKKLIQEPKHPLKNLRKAQSLMSFEKKYGREALEWACTPAILFEKYNYHYIKKCLENYQRNLKTQTTNGVPQRQESLICLQGGKYE